MALSVISSSIELGGRPERLTAGRYGVHQLGVVHSGGRQVDRHRDEVAGAVPGGALGERLREHPARELADHAGLLGEGDEDVGHQQPTCRVLPAHQSFDTGDELGARVDLGLVVEAELALLDRIGQLACEREAREAGPLEVVAVAPHLAAVGLGLVHGHLGPPQQGGHVETVAFVVEIGLGDPDAPAKTKAYAPDLDRLRQRGEKARS